jgi:hypothetical protein
MKIYPDDWRIRLTTGLVAVACIAAALILGPVVGIHGFWPGMLAVVVAIIIGNLLGRLVCQLLFPPAGGPPENVKKDEMK